MNKNGVKKYFRNSLNLIQKKKKDVKKRNQNNWIKTDRHRK